MTARRISMGLIVFVWLASFLAIRAAEPPAAGVTPDEALQKLVEGNKRYVAGAMTKITHCDEAARQSVAKSQKPFAIILSCSDSRVPPEIIFDQGLGDIFVVRVAGNVPDPVTIGSIEYAAEYLGSPLVLVLGHERCGAVTAAVDAKGEPEGNIGAIVKRILPAVEEARSQVKGKDKAELVETAISDNAILVAKSLTRQAPVLRRLVKEGKLKIAVGKYDLDDGKVTILEAPTSEAKPAAQKNGRAKAHVH